MSYYINSKNLSSAFTVPCRLADQYLKLCSHLQLKVILYIFRNMSCEISAEAIAEYLSVPVSDVNDALMYWTNSGLILSDNADRQKDDSDNVISLSLPERPTRADVIKRGNEDKQVMFLMREAQVKFGRNLKSNEATALLWIYDDLGLPISVILMLIQFAHAEGRLNISFIEKTAVDWANKGIQSLTDAEAQIAENARKKTAWGIVQSVFGIEKRLPSSKELEYSDRWVNEWKIDRTLLKSAYDVCIDNKTKLSMPYINKVLETWNKSGVKNNSNIEKKDAGKSRKAKPSAAYDLSLFEKMLNSDD